VDGRNGIDSLAALCREKLPADPFSEWVFVFRTRRMAQKRLPKGASAGGRRELDRERWKRTRRSCRWRQAIRKQRRRRRGGE